MNKQLLRLAGLAAILIANNVSAMHPCDTFRQVDPQECEQLVQESNAQYEHIKEETQFWVNSLNELKQGEIVNGKNLCRLSIQGMQFAVLVDQATRMRFDSNEGDPNISVEYVLYHDGIPIRDKYMSALTDYADACTEAAFKEIDHLNSVITGSEVINKLNETSKEDMAIIRYGLRVFGY